jgi:hypothetical protein
MRQDSNKHYISPLRAVTFAAGFGLNPIVAGVDQCGISAIRWNFGLILKCRPQEPQQPATTHRIRIHC